MTLWLRWIFFSCPGGGLQSEATRPPAFSVTQDTQAPLLWHSNPYKKQSYSTLYPTIMWRIEDLTTAWSYLVYHQRLDLAFKDLHASRSNNWSHIWDYTLTENLADQTMVALETSCSWVLYGKSVIVIWRWEKHFWFTFVLCNVFSYAYQKAKSWVTNFMNQRLWQTTAQMIQNKRMQILTRDCKHKEDIAQYL